MKGDTLIVFARAPRLGTVKRRLAARYRRRWRRCASIAASWRGCCASSGGTGAGGRSSPSRPTAPAGRPACRWSPQGGGDLGQRMGRALFAPPPGGAGRQRHPRASAAADIAAAFSALGRADAVFGPAEDGGYWLVGLGPRRPAAPFAGVRWSSEHALADTLANCRGHRVALLRRLRDVDTMKDLLAARGRMP